MINLIKRDLGVPRAVHTPLGMYVPIFDVDLFVGCANACFYIALRLFT